jgi:hypothetical protein
MRDSAPGCAFPTVEGSRFSPPFADPCDLGATWARTSFSGRVRRWARVVLRLERASTRVTSADVMRRRG